MPDAQPSPRVISLAPAVTEMLFALDCGGFVVGRTSVCNVPVEVQKLPVVGDFSKPDVERVLAQKPTLVLATALLNPKTRPLLEKSGCKVHVAPAETLDDYCNWIQYLGETLNVKGGAEREIARVNRWRKDRENAPRKGGRVLFILWDSPLIVAGENTLPDVAIRYAGAENAIQGQPGYFKCSPEVLLDKDILYVVWAADRKMDETSPLYRQLVSVPGRRFYTDFSQDELLRPGPRFTGAVDKLRADMETRGMKR